MYDIRSIKNQFKSVIDYTQGISNPQIDDLFEQWEKSKRKFIDRFGGLVYEWSEPVEFTLDQKEKTSRVVEFIDCISNVFRNDSLADFLDLNMDTFFENKVSNPCGKKIPEGMKLIKAFKFFESNKEALRDMQDMASQLIQENKIKGTLCFSVHPLDFLTSSENTYNWRSCHALDGEYRAGNLSYMVDKTTFMVYLKGADNVNLPALPSTVKWNSKKWRMLIHAHEDDKIIFAGRQYPFSSKSGIDLVLNIYNNIIDETTRNSSFWYQRNKYRNWCDDYVCTYSPKVEPNALWELDDRYVVYNGALIGLHDIVKSGYRAMNYNDILNSTCYTRPYYAIMNTWSHNIDLLRQNPIIVGGAVNCLYCGEPHVTNPETMRCNDCEMDYGYEVNDSYGICDNCGCRIYFDDAYYVNDEYICDHCFNNYCFVCDECGEAYYNHDKHCVKIDEDTVEYYCPHCYENYIDKGED